MIVAAIVSAWVLIGIGTFLAILHFDPPSERDTRGDVLWMLLVCAAFSVIVLLFFVHEQWLDGWLRKPAYSPRSRRDVPLKYDAKRDPFARERQEQLARESLDDLRAGRI